MNILDAFPERRRHVSASQLNMYARCPEQYRRRYVENEIIPPGVAATKGKSVHVGAELNFRQKITTMQDLRPADIVDASVTAFEESTQGGLTLNEEEQARGKSVVVGEGKDSVVRLASLFAKEVAPEYQPLFVEEKHEIELPDSPRTLLGILDLSAVQADIVDLKTGARAMSQQDVDDSIQLSGYSVTYTEVLKQPPRRIVIEDLVDTGKTQKRVKIETTRDAAARQRFVERAVTTAKAIEAGIFPPGQPGWWCSKRFCGYWETCKVRP